ncbi:MAG: hypothetical protein AABX70_07510 [Nanoarchaeota archaeon]
MVFDEDKGSGQTLNQAMEFFSELLSRKLILKAVNYSGDFANQTV